MHNGRSASWTLLPLLLLLLERTEKEHQGMEVGTVRRKNRLFQPYVVQPSHISGKLGAAAVCQNGSGSVVYEHQLRQHVPPLAPSHNCPFRSSEPW